LAEGVDAVRDRVGAGGGGKKRSAMIAIINPLHRKLPHMLPIESIATRIITIRGVRVMLDWDLAALYEVETRRLNEQVRRNENRFPADFMFQLTDEEFRGLMSQIATSNDPTAATPRGGRRKLPFAFTEHGALQAASVLNSPRAAEVSIYIVRAFVQLRGLLSANEELATQLKALDKRLSQRLATHDQAITGIIDTLRKLMHDERERSAVAANKRPIGFVHPEDKKPKATKPRATRT